MPSPRVKALSSILKECVPGASSLAREVLARLALNEGYIRGSDRFARSLGLRHRHQLAYRLRCEGLPPLQSLARWIRIMVWLVECEPGGSSLCAPALQVERDPAYRYHLVKDVLGIEWSVLQQRGFDWLLLEFINTCVSHSIRRSADLRVHRLPELLHRLSS